MAQIGEFSFIIASLGLSLGVISDFLYPVVVAVSVITTFLTPYMIRLATPVYSALEHRLPSHIIKTLNHLSMSHPDTKEQSKWKRLLTQMSVYTIVYSILSSAVIALMFTFVLPFTRRRLGTPLVCQRHHRCAHRHLHFALPSGYGHEEEPLRGMEGPVA